MAKLTMNTPGSRTPRQAEFMPQKPQPISKWTLIGGGALFLTVFGGLVVATTLLITGDRTPEVTFRSAATALEEPSLVDLTNAVTRQEISLLRAEAAAALSAQALTSASPSPQPMPVAMTPDPQPAAQVEVPAQTRPVLRLGTHHRYKVPSCVDYLDTLVKITSVRFPLGSDKPIPADMIRVRNIATAVKTCDEVKVIVEGHSDRRGDAKLNMELSWFRAQSVIDQLQREGFDIAGLQPRGFGATRPINVSGTISGEAQNRRVQFTLAPRRSQSTLPWTNGN